MSFPEDNVEQSFTLARSGYSQIMLRMKALEGDDSCPHDLILRMSIVKDALQNCTELLQKLYRVTANNLTPQGTRLLGSLAALLKRYYDSQWQNQVVKPTLPSPTGIESTHLHQELAIANINHCLNELLELVNSDEQASKQMKYCLGILTQLLQMHCMSDGLALVEAHADYRALFFREFYPRMLIFSPQIVSFMLMLHNRASNELPREN